MTITPAMRDIMQVLSDKATETQRVSEFHSNQLKNYILQCAQRLGLDQNQVEGFNLAAGSFIMKPTG